MLATRLRQVSSSGDAELRRERLEQHRHEIADDDHAEQRVAKFRSAADIGRPVPWVHISDRDQIPRPRKRENFSQPGRALGDGHGAMRFGKGRQRNGLPVCVVDLNVGERRGLSCGVHLAVAFTRWRPFARVSELS